MKKDFFASIAATLDGQKGTSILGWLLARLGRTASCENVLTIKLKLLLAVKLAACLIFSEQALPDRASQAEFLKSVTVEKERKEQVKFRVRAQWATETKMREVLKLKERLDTPKKQNFGDCVNRLFLDTLGPKLNLSFLCLRSRIRAIVAFCERHGQTEPLGSWYAEPLTEVRGQTKPCAVKKNTLVGSFPAHKV